MQPHPGMPPLDGNLLKDFRDDGLFTDVTISVGSDQLKAHKIVLAARSDVFRAMFTSGMTESSGAVVIEDIEPDVFRDFLNYLYTGESELLLQRPADLLMCADKYNIEALHGACDDSLAELVTTESLAELSTLTHIFNLPHTKGAIVELLLNKSPSPIFDDQVWSAVVGNFEIFTTIIKRMSGHFFFKSVAVKYPNGKLVPVSLNDSEGSTEYFVSLDTDGRGESLDVGLQQESPIDPAIVPPVSIVLIEQGGKVVHYERAAPRPFRNLLHSRRIACCPCDSIFSEKLIVSIALYSEIRIFRGLEISKGGNVHTEFADFFRFYDEFIAHPTNLQACALNIDNVLLQLYQLEDSQDSVFDGDSMKIFQYLILHMSQVIKKEDWNLLKHRPNLMLQIMLVIKGMSDWSYRFRLRK